MADITREDLLRIAHLAKLSVEESQLDSLAVEMSRMIAFADSIHTVPESEEFDGRSGMPNACREDIVYLSYDREEILKNAGGGEDGFFCLPKQKGEQP